MKEVINFWNNLYYSDRAFLLKQLFKNTTLLFCKVFTLERYKVYIGFILIFIFFKGFSHSGEESTSLSNGENMQELVTPGENTEQSSNLSEEDIKLACEAPFQTPLLSQEQYSVANLKRAMISSRF